MRLRFALPQIGSETGPQALLSVAKHRGHWSFDNVGIIDRIFWRINPRARYSICHRALLDKNKNVPGPLQALTLAAAHANRKPGDR